MKRKSLNWFHLIFLMVKRDMKVRYRGSVLGYSWSMLNPLLSMIVLATIFSHVVKIETQSYPLYVLSGLISWNMFAQSLGMGVNSIINNGFILRKVAVPSWVFPTAALSSAALNSIFALAPYTLISIALNHSIGFSVIQLPFVFLLYVAFIHGVVMILSSLNVLFRDVGHVMEPVLQIIFYGSPILYEPSIIPEKIRFFLNLNPVTQFIDAIRMAIYSGEWLTPQHMLILICLATISPLIGKAIYKRTRTEFIYAL